jgi:hypothetical protein
MYAAHQITNVNLREQFITDIIAQIRELQSAGNAIQLSFDANEASGPGSGVARIMCQCGLSDAHSLCTSDSSPMPATYQRGSKKIDFVLISPSLVAAVVGVSILALHDGYLSDHRALVVDYNATLLFGGPTTPIVTPQPRRLTSTNPVQVHTYISHMRSHFETHVVSEKRAALVAKSDSGNWESSDVDEYNRLDDTLQRGRAASENKCTPRLSGILPWSPELHLAGTRLEYWKLRLTEFTTRDTNETTLAEMAYKADISEDDIVWQTAAVITVRLREARRLLNKVQKNADTLHEQYRAEMAKFSAVVHGMDAGAARKAIDIRERAKKQFRQLRSVLKPATSHGLDRIDVPNEYAVLREGEEVPRIPLVTIEEMEDVLLPHTEKRFRQHQETPFGSDPRRRELGRDCSSKDASALLDGTYDRDLDKLSEEARCWLKQLQRKPYTQQVDGVISTAISTEEWVQGWS